MKSAIQAIIGGLLRIKDIMKTIAAVLTEINNPLQIEELIILPLKKGQVLVEVAYSGICHSQLNEIHGSVELDRYCISENEHHLRERLKYLIKTYKQSVLVEEYIVGKEIVAILLEGLNKKVYLGESVIDKPTGKYKFQSFELKWLLNGPTIRYQKFQDPILREYVKKAFTVCDMNDYGKFDIIVDSSGRYFFIDSNSNPELGPIETESPVTMIMEMYGVGFLELMKRILINSVRGYKGKKKLAFPY